MSIYQQCPQCKLSTSEGGDVCDSCLIDNERAAWAKEREGLIGKYDSLKVLLKDIRAEWNENFKTANTGFSFSCSKHGWNHHQWSCPVCTQYVATANSSTSDSLVGISSRALEAERAAFEAKIAQMNQTLEERSAAWAKEKAELEDRLFKANEEYSALRSTIHDDPNRCCVCHPKVICSKHWDDEQELTLLRAVAEASERYVEKVKDPSYEILSVYPMEKALSAWKAAKEGK